ncbi:MAG: TerC family protein [Chitinophagia bacterium]|jgi:predicted tellurium resistance membrane protein TerC
MESLFTSEHLISFFILVILEVVLGIDNVIFVSIIMNRLASSYQQRARTVWMVAGILTRTALLFALSWLLQQKGKPVFTLAEKPFDLASLIMLAGGLFLIYKTVKEIHHKLEGEELTAGSTSKTHISFYQGMMQIILIDMVFSFDSIITAGGTAKRLEIMIAAVIVAMIIMFLFSAKIAAFIHKHPTLKMLALSFLVMIGFVLLVEGWNPEKAHGLNLKNYVYFSMAFSFVVEMLNMRLRTKTKPVSLREPVLPEEEKE